MDLQLCSRSMSSALEGAWEPKIEVSGAQTENMFYHTLGLHHMLGVKYNNNKLYLKCICIDGFASLSIDLKTICFSMIEGAW